MRKSKAVMPEEPLENQRTTFKFQSLLQDYQDLLKETDAKMKKMQLMKERKTILAGEVRFLRKKYEYLTKNKTMNLQQIQTPRQLKNSNANLTNNKSIPMKRNHPVNQRTVAGSETKKKARVVKGKKPSPPIADLNHKHNDVSSLPLRNSVLVFDLNHKERSLSGKETSARSSALFFDLNQISRDEEELQMNTDPSKTEDLQTSLGSVGNDEQLNDMKLSGCRAVGSGSGRAGKRKITWQDQVALRV